MFTRYKSVEIPPNYSGNRFKNEAPITETKMHKPSVSSSTKTSISPTFESALKSGQIDYADTPISEEINDTVSDFTDNYENLDENFSYDFEDRPQVNFNEDEKAEDRKKDPKSLLDEFKPFISRLLKNVSSEDLLLLSLVILLLSEGNDDSSELIIPLLLLFLYR